MTPAIEELERLVEELLQRIENGHPQSIGAIHNVRMVQYGVEEVPRYRASLHALLPLLRAEVRERERKAFVEGVLVGRYVFTPSVFHNQEMVMREAEIEALRRYKEA